MEDLNVSRKRLENVKKIMIFSGKGGVGKSTVAVNIAYALAFEKGFKTGLMDIDIHGPNIPKLLGIETQKLHFENNKIKPVIINENLRVVSIAFLLDHPDTAVIWRGPLKVKIIRQFADDVNWEDIKFLVIDLPPGTGDEPLSVAQELQPVDGSIIVTTPQDLSLLDSRKAIDFSMKLGIPVIGVVENMSGLICPYCGGKIELFKSGGGEKTAKELGVPFLAKIPIEPEIVNLADSGITFVEALKDSESYKVMIEIVDKILNFLK